MSLLTNYGPRHTAKLSVAHFDLGQLTLSQTIRRHILGYKHRLGTIPSRKCESSHPVLAEAFHHLYGHKIHCASHSGAKE